MHFILKMLIAKYGKDIAVKMYDEYKKSKTSGAKPPTDTKGFRVE